MKKITLAALAMVAYVGSAFSQATVLVQAPPFNGASTQVRAPNGNVSHTAMRACFLVRASELSALTGTSITNFGFFLINGTAAVPVTGNFTVSMQNTNDVTYNKGLSFSGALTGMTTVYTSTMTLPVAAGSTSINLTLAPAFTYTGGGIYVAINWVSSGPFDANFATYEANNALAGGCASTSSATAPAPDAMGSTAFRPACLFGAANTATNEIAIENVFAPGSVAQSLNAGHVIRAEIRNGSVGAKTNIPVLLSVTGANTFTDLVVIPTLAAGATTTVSFASFNPQNAGLNVVTATVSPDQISANNSKTWAQRVTCSTYANTPPEANTFTAGIGLTNPNTIVNKITAPASGTLAALRLAIANATINPGNQVYGVIFDAAGTLIATTNTITIGSTMLGTFVKVNFASPPALVGGTDYLIGMGQPASGFFPFGAYSGTATPVTDYFIVPEPGGAPQAVNAGVFGFEAVFTSTAPVMNITPSKTITCAGESVVLAASGASTYVWNTNATTSSITVSPTAPTGYTVTGTDANGCVNSKTYTANVVVCTGLTANANDGLDINVFPNPATSGKTTITGLVGSNTIAVYNLLGQMISTQSSSDSSVEVDFNNQPAGNYLIKITNTMGQTKTLKIVNQN